MAETPIILRIRKIIFERFNNPAEPFTNDAVFEALRRDGNLDHGWMVDDIEQYINEICDSGMARNIAQNFTTVWLKLFDVVEQHSCNACKHDVFLGRAEDRTCPNPSCSARI